MKNGASSIAGDLRSRATRGWAFVSITALLTAGAMSAAHAYVGDERSHWMAVFAFFTAALAAAMAWMCFNRTLSQISSAIDKVTERLDGGLDGDVPEADAKLLRSTLPTLADSLDTLLDHARGRLSHESHRATTDPVTTLANRTHFRDLVEPMLSQYASGALLFIDLDRFKNVNDKLGHAAGDRVLAEIANRLMAVAGKERGSGEEACVVGRLAGDEFTIFIPGSIDRKQASAIAQNVLNTLRRPMTIDGQTLSIGASIGLALAPEHGASLTDLMKSADIAMYHAKSRGRRQVQLFTGVLADREADRRRTVKNLKAGLKTDQFALVFQPQVDLHSGAITGVEGLLRWTDEDGNVRSPSQFIDIAEDSGLILGIGDKVTDAAASALARWKAAGLEHRLSINLSQRQIDQPQLLRHLIQSFDRHGVDRQHLGLEIAEAVIMRCDDSVLKELAALRESGLSIAIDDFGTSSSNLPKLQRLPIDRVKLDRSLIRDIVANEGSRSIATSVIGLIHGLGFETVAEGVETSEQLDLLRAMGCSAAQGYAICRPMDEAAFLKWAAGRPGVVIVDPDSTEDSVENRAVNF